MRSSADPSLRGSASKFSAVSHAIVEISRISLSSAGLGDQWVLKPEARLISRFGAYPAGDEE
jgi:hypothetical protein